MGGTRDESVWVGCNSLTSAWNFSRHFLVGSSPTGKGSSPTAEWRKPCLPLRTDPGLLMSTVPRNIILLYHPRMGRAHGRARLANPPRGTMGHHWLACWVVFLVIPLLSESFQTIFSKRPLSGGGLHSERTAYGGVTGGFPSKFSGSSLTAKHGLSPAGDLTWQARGDVTRTATHSMSLAAAGDVHRRGDCAKRIFDDSPLLRGSSFGGRGVWRPAVHENRRGRIAAEMSLADELWGDQADLDAAEVERRQRRGLGASLEGAYNRSSRRLPPP